MKQHHLLVLVLLSLSGAAIAETPERVFKMVSQTVVRVEGRESKGEPIRLGSGVIVGDVNKNWLSYFPGGSSTGANDDESIGTIATNCHVVKDALLIVVRHEGKEYLARLIEEDLERDLCLIRAPKLNSIIPPNFRVTPPRVGERVYAIGTPKGLELTLSEGLVSGLRRLPDGTSLIQTSAPISPGSSGGGLFDDQGQLMGITTATLSEGQNLNFAIPAEWIGQVEPRASERKLAERKRENKILESAYLEWADLARLAESEKDAQARRALMDAAILGLQDGKRQEARDRLLDAVKFNKRSGYGWLFLGSTYLAQRDVYLAEQALEIAQYLLPDNPNLIRNLALIYVANRETEKFNELMSASAARWPTLVAELRPLQRF